MQSVRSPTGWFCCSLTKVRGVSSPVRSAMRVKVLSHRSPSLSSLFMVLSIPWERVSRSSGYNQYAHGSSRRTRDSTLLLLLRRRLSPQTALKRLSSLISPHLSPQWREGRSQSVGLRCQELSRARTMIDLGFISCMSP